MFGRAKYYQKDICFGDLGGEGGFFTGRFLSRGLSEIYGICMNTE